METGPYECSSGPVNYNKVNTQTHTHTQHHHNSHFTIGEIFPQYSLSEMNSSAPAYGKGKSEVVGEVKRGCRAVGEECREVGDECREGAERLGKRAGVGEVQRLGKWRGWGSAERLGKCREVTEEWRGWGRVERLGKSAELGEERAFSGEYHDCKRSGTYRCTCCGTPLFHSAGVIAAPEANAAQIELWNSSG